MKIYEYTSRSKYFAHAVHSVFLLAPGGITALLLFLLSSNRLLPGNSDLTVFILNLIILQTLGITISKYGADQVVLSQLQKNNFIFLKELYKKRVLPIIFIFCLCVGFIKGISYSFYFLLILPMEVFSIITCNELNVSHKFKKAFVIVLSGYPLILVCVYIFGYFNQLSLNISFIIFFFSSIIRILLSILFKNRGEEEHIAIISLSLPLQQVGNHVMFRLDQLIIAAGLSNFFLSQGLKVTQYLFLAKFPELSSGIIVGLAPILYKKLGDENSFALKSLIKNKYFLIMSIALTIFQIGTYIIFQKSQEAVSNILIYLPFIVSTLFILPSNLITYILFKTSAIRKVNMLNFIACGVGSILVLTAIAFKSTILFCFTIPAMLFTYIYTYFKLVSK